MVKKFVIHDVITTCALLLQCWKYLAIAEYNIIIIILVVHINYIIVTLVILTVAVLHIY